MSNVPDPPKVSSNARIISSGSLIPSALNDECTITTSPLSRPILWSCLARRQIIPLVYVKLSTFIVMELYINLSDYITIGRWFPDTVL